jgi:hypothetical protein
MTSTDWPLIGTLLWSSTWSAPVTWVFDEPPAGFFCGFPERAFTHS